MAKLPFGIIKNAGNLFAQTKQPSQAGSSTKPVVTSPPEEIPFSGEYDTTVKTEIATEGLQFTVLVPTTSNPNPPGVKSKVHLDSNGHPLVLPLPEMHPGFAESVSLEVGSSFDTRQAVKLSGVTMQPNDCHWVGTCKPDGSAFRISLTAHLMTITVLRVVIEGTRSVGN